MVWGSHLIRDRDVKRDTGMERVRREWEEEETESKFESLEERKEMTRR